jgi:hypothetical protein
MQFMNYRMQKQNGFSKGSFNRSSWIGDYMGMRRNVAWWATGKLYKHQAGVNPNFIWTALVVEI